MASVEDLLAQPFFWIVIVFLLWWGASQIAFERFDPFSMFQSWRRRQALRHVLEINPHDRQVRLALGDLLSAAGRHREVLDVLRPNLEAGDDDALLAFLWGISSASVGDFDAAERAFVALEHADAEFRLDAVNLERGRARLRAKDYRGAKDALEHFCQQRPGTVEGKVLLARALEGLGDGKTANTLRAQAWVDFEQAPRFRRRAERLWAYRANPMRAAIVAGLSLAVAIATLIALGMVGRAL